MTMVGVTATRVYPGIAAPATFPVTRNPCVCHIPRVGQSDVAGSISVLLRFDALTATRSGRSVGMFFPATPGYVPLVRFCGDFTAVPD